MKLEFWEEAYNSWTDDSGCHMWIMTKDEFLNYYDNLRMRWHDAYPVAGHADHPLSWYLTKLYPSSNAYYDEMMKHCPEDMNTVAYAVPDPDYCEGDVITKKFLFDVEYYEGYAKVDIDGNIVDYDFS